jgi:tol-pal system protein YbgF
VNPLATVRARSPAPTRGRARSAPGRGLRLALAAAVALGSGASGGCATKRDMRDLRAEVAHMQARQDSLIQMLILQNRAVADSVNQSKELLLRLRGELGHQLIQIEQQLVEVQSLTGQSQTTLADLRRQLQTRSDQYQEPPGGGEAGGGDVEQLYTIGADQLQRGAAGTARRAFEQILAQHATHERAPDAQFHLAETFVIEGQREQAMEAFERVVERYPNSPRAPTALYRAGMLAEEAGNNQRARGYFQRVLAGYPRSDEARLAEERMRRLRR